MNIVSTMMQFITPMIASRIASALGIPNTMVTAALTAALPAILAGLAGKAATPSGASALSTALQGQDPKLLGSFADMLGGPQQAAFVNNGTSALTGLLGGASTNALTGALAKFTGASTQQSGSLIGMLAPVVLGQLAGAQKSSGLDAGGLAKLLDGQKSNIAAAMPSGFSDLLSGSGLLDSVAGNLKAAAPKVEAPRKPAAAGFNWMPWAIGSVAVLGAAYMFGTKPSVPSMPAPKVAVPTPAIAGANLAMDEAKKIFGGLTSSLGTIKDASSAQAALPQLTASSLALDGLTKMAGSLAPDAKTQLRLLVAATMPQLSPLVETALKIPGAEAILKPVMDAILAKMTGLSKI